MLAVMSILALSFLGTACFFVQRVARHLMRTSQDKVIELQDFYHGRLEQKKKTVAQRAEFEKEAYKIFMLYEVTKDLTKTFSQEAVMKIFKQKLRENLQFEECQFFDSPLEEAKISVKKDQCFTFTLQWEGKEVGYLALQGVPKSEEEKAAILGNQLALALRRVKLYQELENMAVTDSLTGAYTRRYFMARFEEELKRSSAHHIPMAFLMLDIDYFKSYNDRYGHLAGDQILNQISEVIKSSIRQIDFMGRYGGEEFSIILPDTRSEGAEFVAERIRLAVAQARMKVYDTTLNVTISIGIASFPKDGHLREELLDRADWALYRAKKMGRNRVCAFGIYESS